MRRMRTGIFLLAGVGSILLGVAAAFFFARAPAEGTHGSGAAATMSGQPSSHGASLLPAQARPPVPPVRLALSPAQKSVPGLALDPSASEYDARKLIRLTGDVKAVYEAEPRNPAWAAAVEARIQPALTEAIRAIDPNVRETKMECRSTMCAISWTVADVAEGANDRARYIALQLFPGTYGLSGAKGHLVRWDNFNWKGDIRDTEAFLSEAEGHLARAAQRLRGRDLSLRFKETHR